MQADVNSSPNSFRDPAGIVVVRDGRIFRIVRKSHGEFVRRFIKSAFFARRCAAGSFPGTREVRDQTERLQDLMQAQGAECVLEHDRIPFPVHPHEWSPSMLYEAGQLTLDLAEEALADGWMLKDATPWNVLYSGGRMVFCDILSFEPRGASRIWFAYAQFQRTFVLPLYAHSRHAWPVHSLFLDRRDGVDPMALASVVRGWRRWAPFELQIIVLPAKLSLRAAVPGGGEVAAGVTGRGTANQQLADFVLRRSFRRLRKQLAIVRPRPEKLSAWINYDRDRNHYAEEDREMKAKFVRAALLRTGAGRVLDIGANTGEYSLMAAAQGATVVAADVDVAVLEKLCVRIKAERLQITPMVLNIARPTPALGWNNREVESFLIRARGQFHMIMVLALLHHLIVTERVPVEFVIKLLFDLDAPFLLIEWVSTTDPRFHQIAKTHGQLYESLSVAAFERALSMHFRIVKHLVLASNSRTLYLCERR